MIQGIPEDAALSEELPQLINMCVQYKPQDRPTASDVLDALTKVSIKLNDIAET